MSRRIGACAVIVATRAMLPVATLAQGVMPSSNPAAPTTAEATPTAINHQVDTSAGRIGAYVNGTYNSGVFYDAANTVKQRHHGLLDAELSFSPSAVRGLRLVAWSKNLTGKNYIASTLTLGYVLGASYADPRTYGVRADFAF